MLTFKSITARDTAMLRRYYENCNYELCEYSAGVKLMWRSTLHYTWAEAAGCLIVRCESEGRVSFDYPVAGPEGDEDAALTAIETYCIEKGILPEISIVPEEKAPRLLARYPYVRVSNIRTWRDYLYYKEDLQLFAGRRYSGQRNHIKKFRNCHCNPTVSSAPQCLCKIVMTIKSPAVEPHACLFVCQILYMKKELILRFFNIFLLAANTSHIS